MKLYFLIILFIISWCKAQETIEFKGKDYYLYPENQDEKNWNSTYLPNKVKTIRGYYKIDNNKNIDGKWIQFYMNNDTIPAKIFELKNNKFNGEFIQFYKSGKVEHIYNFFEDYRIDLGIGYHENGVIRDSVIYRLDTAQNGVVFMNKVFLKTFYKNGQLKKHENYDTNGIKNGRWTEFYENGNLKIEQYFSSKSVSLYNASNRNAFGNRISTFNYFHQNGQPRFTLRYENNHLLNTEFIEYFSNGEIKFNGKLKDGLRHGKWTEYYKNGQIKSEGKFESAAYSFCSIVSYTQFYNYKVDEWKYFYPNGDLLATGIYNIKIKNISTNCEGGADIKVGGFNDTWQFFGLNRENIDAKYLIQKGVLEKDEYINQKVYDIN